MHITKDKTRHRARLLCRKNRLCWFRVGRTGQWWDNMMNNTLPDKEWKKNFRMPRLGIKLYYLKDTGSLSMTANSFGLHISTVANVIHDVLTGVNSWMLTLDGQEACMMQKCLLTQVLIKTEGK